MTWDRDGVTARRRGLAAMVRPVARAAGRGLLGAAALLAAAAPSAVAEEPPPSPELVRQGRGFYRQFCSNCHGVNMVNAGTSSFDLRKFPPDDRERFFT